MSAFFGPDQAATEAKLIVDPDCRPWVEKYQRSRETVSRTDYEVQKIRQFVPAGNANAAGCMVLKSSTGIF
jgi:L-ascorbate peroxidase